MEDLIKIKALKNFEIKKKDLGRIAGGQMQDGTCTVLTKYSGNPELQDDVVNDA